MGTRVNYSSADSQIVMDVRNKLHLSQECRRAVLCLSAMLMNGCYVSYLLQEPKLWKDGVNFLTSALANTAHIRSFKNSLLLSGPLV